MAGDEVGKDGLLIHPMDTITKPIGHPKSVRHLTKKVRSYGHFKKEEAHLAVMAVMKAIRDSLVEGQEIAILRTGVFYFGFRPGRHMPAIFCGKTKYQRPASYQEPSYPLKFAMTKEFRALIRGRTPVQFRKRNKKNGTFTDIHRLKPNDMKYDKPDGTIELASSGCGCNPDDSKRSHQCTNSTTQWWRIKSLDAKEPAGWYRIRGYGTAMRVARTCNTVESFTSHMLTSVAT